MEFHVQYWLIPTLLCTLLKLPNELNSTPLELSESKELTHNLEKLEVAVLDS